VLGSSTLLTRLRPIALAAAVVATLLAAPSTADAAKRKVPFGFFGAVSPPLLAGVNNLRLDEQMGVMAQSGVESIRITRAWNELEPSRGNFRFAQLDRMVGTAARHGLQTLINVTSTPRWASSKPNSPDAYRLPPRDNGTYAELMRELVLRYGPTGTYWQANPTVPRVPVRQWQIWNEPSGEAHWKPRPWAPSYTRLLRAAYTAIHAVDRGAEVASGPLVATGTYTQWRAMSDLLRAGARRYLDVVSVHPFTNDSTSAAKSAKRVLEIVRLVRQRMNKGGARRVPIILTEMTWPASLGKAPKGAQLHFSTTSRGQAARLKAAYRALIRARRKLRVTNAYWYTWATTYDRKGPLSVMAFNFSGLTRFRGGAFSPMPILRVYRNVAASYQGCRKSADARRCR
jgi:hypothetical protein